MFSARARGFAVWECLCRGWRRRKVRGQRMLIDLSALFPGGRRESLRTGPDRKQRVEVKAAISRCFFRGGSPQNELD